MSIIYIMTYITYSKLCLLIRDRLSYLRWFSGDVDSWVVAVTMKAAVVVTLVYLVCCESAVVVEDLSEAALNDRPIIGVLAQEQSWYLHTKYPEENYTSYIAASYVKDVEASGARVVPIM